MTSSTPSSSWPSSSEAPLTATYGAPIDPNHHHALPAGASWRRPALDDAEAIFELVSAYNTATVGFADVTLDDVTDELVEPGFDRERDGWLVHGRDGRLLGWAWAFGRPTSPVTDVEVVTPEPAVARWLFDRVLERAGELIAATGHREGTADVGVYRRDQPQQQLVAARGFTMAATYHRMRVDHDGQVDEPPLPEGVTVVTGGDMVIRRDAHAVQRDAFAGQFGFVEQDFEHWQEGLDASAIHDWEQLQVAYVDRRPMAMLLGNDQFAEDEQCGYVRSLGVRAEQRGRGLARLLLRRAFARDARAGRVGTLLHVNTANPTPALDLYRSVGMRVVLVIDMWRRPVRA